MAELVEGARLLSECSGKLEPWVRIPLSPLFYAMGLRFMSPVAFETENFIFEADLLTLPAAGREPPGWDHLRHSIFE